MMCTAIDGAQITGIDWVVDDHDKPVPLVSHNGTGRSSLQENEEGFTRKFGSVCFYDERSF